MMGHLGKAVGTPPPFDKIRLYAPALLRTSVNKVAYLPIAFAEVWIDLSTATPSATSPVPALVAQSYADYFKLFREGKYNLVAAPLDASGEGVEANVKPTPPMMADTTPPADPAPQNDETTAGNGVHAEA